MLEVIVKKAKHKISPYPILCLHGAQGGAWYFEKYLEYYSALGYDIYSMSLRGHGLSDGYELIDTYTLDDYVMDLLEVVEHIDEKPILFAHSMGGAIAQRFLNTYQDKLKALFLLSSAPAKGIKPDSDLGLYYQDQLSFLRKLRKTKDKSLTLDMLMKTYVFSPSFSDELIEDIRKKFVKESNAVKYDLMKPYLKEEIKIQIPVFVFGSLNDGILTEEDIIETASRFQTKPIWVDGLSHFVTLDPNYMVLIEKINEKLEEIIL